ncbi:MAG: glycosyltransferase [bacterium]|nr:glycosyltransferase [bacterium]
MKIVLANYRKPFPLYPSGADLSNQVLVKHLQQRGHQIETLFTTGPFDFDRLLKELAGTGLHGRIEDEELHYEWDGVRLRVVKEADYFPKYERLLAEFKPDIVMMHNPYFDTDVTQFFKDKSQNYVCFIRSENVYTMLDGVKDEFKALFSVCEYMKEQTRVRWGKEATVVYSAPEPEFCVSNAADRQPSYITMINPMPAKGAEVLEWLIQRMPDRQFQVVQGWVDPRYHDFHFYKYPNVLYVPNTTDMRPIYAKSRIVIVPSLVKDSLPRVLFEAAYNNVPAIVSNVCGVKEAINDSAIALNEFTVLENWQAAIESLDDADTYNRLAKNCDRVAKAITIETEVDKFEEKLKEIAAR